MAERPPRRVADPQWRHRYPGEVLDLTGQKFGRLTPLRPVDRDGYGRTIWECLCVCGRTKRVRVDFLRNGCTKSCGCLRKRMEPL